MVRTNHQVTELNISTAAIAKTIPLNTPGSIGAAVGSIFLINHGNIHKINNAARIPAYSPCLRNNPIKKNSLLLIQFLSLFIIFLLIL